MFDPSDDGYMGPGHGMEPWWEPDPVESECIACLDEDNEVVADIFDTPEDAIEFAKGCDYVVKVVEWFALDDEIISEDVLWQR